ncbi:helix-turn-helix domain-containing protein [Kibdelosporangium persicum]|uniref:helix-turn-helix domain-containing protein n=1 Tax=Kibdelosporangium persicum TaxID=2698649 RepID=UPI00156776E9|nr:helix-turn-helix transcriptional regulator [Kibdelosporangium persicum]
MPELDREACPRAQLGAKLRRMRQQAGFTLEDAASMLEMCPNNLRRRENGYTKTDVHLARSMMDLYNVPDATLLDEVREACR